MGETKLTLRLLDDERASFTLDYPGVEGYIIGRSDSQSTPPPDIDLAKYNGRERGVSRRHAAIVQYRGDIFLVDLDSVNGTSINDIRVTPDVPYPIEDGDRVTFGDLVITVLRAI